MRTNSSTVAQLARDAGIGVEDALIILWGEGHPELEGPRDVLTGGPLARAQNSLDIPLGREITKPQYWRKVLDLAEPEFANLLQELSINLSPTARRLPKGSVAKLRREAFKRRATKNPTQVQDVVELAPVKFEMAVIGDVRPEMRFLEMDEVVKIHDYLVDDFLATNDPILPPEIRSRDLLSSAVDRPKTAMGSTLKYPTVEMAGAALLHSLVLNHAFHNGNKRTGLVALLVFLDENNLQLTCREQGLFQLVLQVAKRSLVPPTSSSRVDREVQAIAQWILEHSRRVERGEKVVTWVTLRRILAAHGCRTEGSGRGNRIDISREVRQEKKTFLGTRPHTTKLSTHLRSVDDGREVDKGAISKIREQLWLDEAHGVDSKVFYERGESPALDFIVIYRKTLRKLGKL